MARLVFDAEAYLDAAAAVLELRIDPEHRPGVLLNLLRLSEMATLVMEFPLPEEVEPGPVFTP